MGKYQTQAVLSQSDLFSQKTRCGCALWYLSNSCVKYGSLSKYGRSKKITFIHCNMYSNALTREILVVNFSCFLVQWGMNSWIQLV